MYVAIWARGSADWKQFRLPPGPIAPYLKIRSAAGAVRVITSVDGRIASSVYLIIVKVDARSVAGKWRTRGMDWQKSIPCGLRRAALVEEELEHGKLLIHACG